MLVFNDVLAPGNTYRLRDVIAWIQNGNVVFEAVLMGPDGADVWIRAWLSDENSTLSESASGPHKTGDRISISVPIPFDVDPGITINAFARIESAPLKTEHVVGATLRLLSEG
jgi:hypothetical protein